VSLGPRDGAAVVWPLDDTCQTESVCALAEPLAGRAELDAEAAVLAEPSGVVAGSVADVDPGERAPSALSAGVVPPESESSPDARDGASTRLSTPSSSAPLTDTRLSPVRPGLIRLNQNLSYGSL